MAIIDPTAGGYDGPEIGDGLYILTCKNVVFFTPDQPDKFNKMTPKLRLELHGATPEGEAFTLDPLMNRVFSAVPGRTPSTLYTYAEAFGCNPNPDAPFDTDELVGKKLQAFITTEEKEGAWPRIQSFSKVKASSGSKAPPPPPPAASKRPGPVLDPDGLIDWDAFWKETERFGATREGVHKAWGGEDVLTTAPALDVANWLYEWADRVAT